MLEELITDRFSLTHISQTYVPEQWILRDALQICLKIIGDDYRLAPEAAFHVYHWSELHDPRFSRYQCDVEAVEINPVLPLRVAVETDLPEDLLIYMPAVYVNAAKMITWSRKQVAKGLLDYYFYEKSLHDPDGLVDAYAEKLIKALEEDEDL